jgi:TRAP-type C4-dicarboxylate transport system substrate-binding protein
LHVIKYMHNMATNHIPLPAIFNVSTIFFAGLSSSLRRTI